MTLHGPITTSLGDRGGPHGAELDVEPQTLAALSPGALRSTILDQHAQIRRLLWALEDKATYSLSSVVPRPKELRETRKLALSLCSVMESHIDLENRVLAPALESIDAWGPVRARRLREDHAEQLARLRGYAQALRRRAQSGAELAALAWELVMILREDMEHEEESILCAGLLADVAFANDVETG